MSYAYTLWAIKTSKTDTEIVAAWPQFRKAQRFADSPWIITHYLDDHPAALENLDESLTQEPAQHFDEVLFVCVDSSIDSFFYEHAKAEELIRKLHWFVVGEDDDVCSWELATGETEAWEKAVFFTPAKLTDALAALAEELGEESEEFRTEEEKLRAAWNRNELPVGCHYPSADASLGEFVLNHFGVMRPERKWNAV